MLLGDEAQAQIHLARDPGLTRRNWTAPWTNLATAMPACKVHGRVRVGLLYDSNANQGPAYDVMDLGNFQRVRVQDVGEKSLGAYLGGQLDIGYRLQKVGSWWAVADVQAYGRGNFNDELEANTSRYWQWGRAAGGLRYLDSYATCWTCALKRKFSITSSTNISWPPGLSCCMGAVRPYFQLITQGQYRPPRLYVGPGPQRPVLELGRIRPPVLWGQNHEFMAGARCAMAGWPTTAIIRITPGGFSLVHLQAPYRFEVTPMVSYAEEYYDGPATVLETSDREDDRLTRASA